jgi:hypothetical protein
MRHKNFRTFLITALIFICSGELFAQQAFDQYGFGDRAFLIQSAMETGKSANGFWDIPGTPGCCSFILSESRCICKCS